MTAFGRCPRERRSTTKFIYADPGLRNNHGHHAYYCRLITGELRARGIEVVVLATSDVEGSLQAEVSARAHFRTWTYWCDTDPICGWLNTFHTAAELTRQDLALFADYHADDILFWSSTMPPQFMGLVRWLSDIDPAIMPKVVVEFNNEPGLDPVAWPAGSVYRTRDPRTDGRAAFFRLAAGLIPKDTMRSLRLATFDRYCSVLYSELLGYRVGTLPPPYRATGPVHSRSGKRPITIGDIGTQRLDKGYGLIPEVARLLLRARSDIRILLHTSDPSWMPAEQEAVRKLATVDDRLVLDERVADGETWPDIINNVDLMLCPYEPVRYHSSPSAVAFEAVANGIPLVGPKGSSLDRLIKSYGGCGATFEHFTPDSIAATTESVIDRFDEFAGLAMDAATQWAKRAGPSNMVNAMLALLGVGDGVAPTGGICLHDNVQVQITSNGGGVGSRHFSTMKSAAELYPRPIVGWKGNIS